MTVKTSNSLPTHDSHGTRVTGLICGQTNNGTYGASIGYNLKVNHYGVNNLLEYTPLVWQAYIDGNKIINCSFYISIGEVGLGDVEKAMYEEIVAGGCTIVAGGGNENHLAQKGLWYTPGVVIVGGIGADNKHSTPSTNGVKTTNHLGIDLCALANNATTIDVMSGSFVTREGWGTSAATPQVTATIGLMLSVNPCLTPAEIESILKTTTDPIDDAYLFPGTIGTGRLNTYKAVLKAKNWGKEDLILVAGENKTIENIEHYNNIVVNTNATLTVRNTTLLMAKDGRINVDVGGKLMVINSTIKAREPYVGCNFSRYQWDGIAVAGNKSLNQTPISNQGYVFVDRSTIQDAKNAISTYLIDLTTKNIIWSKTGGGIIKTTKSTFKDNGRHIEFYGYQQAKNANNLSSFDETVFEYNGSVDVVSGNRAYYMITAYGVSGVKFNGCTFTNTNGSINADKYGYDRGTGIYVLDGSFILSDKKNTIDCQTIKGGSFYDLTNGMQLVYSPSATLAHRIGKQNFDRNDKAIWLANGLATSIDHNTFNLNVPTNYWNRLKSRNDINYKTGILGIYTPKAAGYRVEQNEFTNLGSKVPGEVVVAFVADNSDLNGGGGFFRLNKVDNSNIGSQTQNRNLSTIISCNEYRNTEKGFQLNLMSPQYSTPSFGVCSYDYSIRKDYQNTFFNNTLDGYHTLPVGGGNIANYKVYLAKPGTLNRPNPAQVYQVFVRNCNYRTNMGEIGYIGCEPREEFKNPCEISSWDKNFNNYKTRYQIGKQGLVDFLQRIDDGRSTDLLTRVQQGGIPAQELFDELLTKSPYLSDEVIINMLSSSNNQLSEEQLTTVLIYNSGFSDEVYNAILAKGFSDENLELLIQAQSLNEPASLLRQREEDSYFSQMINLKNDVIWAANLLRMEEADNVENSVNYSDKLIEFLLGENDLDSKKQLVSTYYLSGYYANANELLQSMTLEGTENVAFKNYYNLMLSARLAGRDIYNLTDEEWDAIALLSTSGTSAGETAKGLLTLVKGQRFDAYVERDNNQLSGKRLPTAIGSSVQEKESDNLLVFPNPTQNKLEIKYASNQLMNNGYIRIVDITGKLVFDKKIKNMQGSIELNDLDWGNGMYFVELIVNDVIIENTKVIINK